jgi:fatty-acyl-CoA synthase/long-chain acyl-CoA synthetase
MDMDYEKLETLTDVLTLHAQRRPEHVALICEQRELTYGQLHRESNRTGRALRAAGLRRGARVAYLGKESEHYYDILFGCAKSETVLVPINWRLTSGEVAHILRDSCAELLFVEQEFAALVGDFRSELRAVVVLDGVAGGFAAWKEPFPDTGLVPGTGPDDAIAQIYTSGTTGLPKGVVLPQRSFFKVRDALASQGLDWIDWRAGDVSLIGIPGFHIGGLWWAMQGFTAGVTNVAMRMFVSSDAVTLIRRHGVTTTCLVPAMLQMILAEPGVTQGHFPTLRKVVYGGSPISETLLQRCIDTIGCEFAQIYGLTETGNTSVCLPPYEHIVGNPRLKAAGRPYPGFALKIIDSDGRLLPVGEVGEVCIRTPAHMLEYWGLEETTARTLVDGWIHTGDAGYLDKEGYVFICDRIKDTIIVAGENVYPVEIENALSKHEGVAEAAVVGIPDERWGEAIHAVVALRPGSDVTPRQLKVFLRGHIADFKIPTSYDVVDRLPRNPSGKLLRRVLRDQYWEHMERKVN